MAGPRGASAIRPANGSASGWRKSSGGARSWRVAADPQARGRAGGAEHAADPHDLQPGAHGQAAGQSARATPAGDRLRAGRRRLRCAHAGPKTRRSAPAGTGTAGRKSCLRVFPARCNQPSESTGSCTPVLFKSLLGAQTVDMERWLPFQFLMSLLLGRRGWLAIHAQHRSDGKG